MRACSKEGLQGPPRRAIFVRCHQTKKDNLSASGRMIWRLAGVAALHPTPLHPRTAARHRVNKGQSEDFQTKETRPVAERLGSGGER